MFALIFGPLGLLYLGLEGLVIVIFVVGVGFFLMPLLMGIKSGAAVAIFGRVACAMYASNAVEKRNGNTSHRAKAIAMLNEAAHLENIDPAQAIIKYEELTLVFGLSC